jgi:hypothetical protein
MSAFGRKLRLAEGGIYLFWCPGCNQGHHVRIGPNGWTFNNDGDRPTFSPSVLVTGTKFTEKGESEYQQWCNDGYPNLGGKAFDHMKTVCHSFVTDGRIQFLNDCTHSLAGQTVDLPDFDESPI